MINLLQRNIGNLLSCNKLRAFLIHNWFCLLATSFWGGVMAYIRCLLIPWTSKNPSNSFERNLPFLLVQRMQFFFPIGALVIALKKLSFLRDFYFSFIKYIQLFLVLSSVEATKYLDPFNEAIFIGPTRSHEWLGLYKCTSFTNF